MLSDKDRDVLKAFVLLLPKLTEREKENLLFYGAGMAAVKDRETAASES